MKYVLYVVGAIVAIIVVAFVVDMMNIAMAQRRIKQARFYLEGPNPDQASKEAARAIKKLARFPTVHGARKDATIEAGEDVLMQGLTGIFAEQYARDLRFNPGPQWDICEARARVSDVAMCIEAAGQAVQTVVHNQVSIDDVPAAVSYLEECVAYETHPEVAALCRENAGRWLAEEAALLLEQGNAPPAAELTRACVTKRDRWEPSEQCLADWLGTVRRARNALLPEYSACEAILYYADMPEGISAADREAAEAELAELRSTTALIETKFYYDVIELRPANGYWGHGEESNKFHLGKILTPKGYPIQWLEEEHPEGAWDDCHPEYTGLIETHEVLARHVHAFKKECITVKVRPELTLYRGPGHRVAVHEKAEGTLPRGWFQDEETFISECERSRDTSWRAAHEEMRQWDIDPIKEGARASAD